ncbi:6945_t:CDS:2 [Ambispora leptoticha]|uniref:6945_t:CDS:1 n=1 Tax=Ambispora leptoticha TaxID=144679 RepID=A0A9N8V5J5_9GLOM|nr:6945_t:CDS:2 [Ambispora leptoticha]
MRYLVLPTQKTRCFWRSPFSLCNRKPGTLSNCLQSKQEQGVVHYELVEERVDVKVFHDFLTSANVNFEEKSYLLLDNASIHRAPKKRKQLGLPTIEEQLNPRNAELTYLPSRSPQLNPVELLFNTIRHNIEKARA